MICENLSSKRLLLAVSMQLFVSLVNAQSVLTINFYSGETYKVSLANKPEITFEGDNLVINGEGVSTSFSRKEIKQFYFDDSPSVVKEINQTSFKIEWVAERMIFLYGEDLMPVRIFDLQGRERMVVLRDNGSYKVLDLKRLIAGTYILAVNNKRNIKIKLR